MAKKKKPVIADAVKAFKEVVGRSPMERFLYQNRCLITTLAQKSSDLVYTVLISVEEALWNALMDDDEWKACVREADIGDPEEMLLAKKAHYVTDELEWIDIDENEFYEGKVIPITVAGYNYNVTVGKTLIPLRLKKSEYNGISYTISPDKVLLLRKTFDNIDEIPNSGYAVYRLFRII